MDALSQYTAIFADIFDTTKEEAVKMKYKDGSWDSVGHMMLISKLEDTFGIIFASEDIMALDSYEKGVEILGKYGISL